MKRKSPLRWKKSINNIYGMATIKPIEMYQKAVS